MGYDLLVTGGQVFDPREKTFRRMDVGVVGGRVGRMAPSLKDEEARERIAASGLMVTPGLIDFHVHISTWSTASASIPPSWSPGGAPQPLSTGEARGPATSRP